MHSEANKYAFMRNSKGDKIEILRRLLTNNQMGSQDEVLKAMAKKGFPLTQSSLSRYMKQLKVVKTSDHKGRYIYVLPDETMYKRVHKVQMADADPMLAAGFESIQFAGNMGVIRTKPGYASGIALYIDRNQLPEVLGTIAGDDTIFMVIRHDVPLNEVLDSLEMIIPGVNLKLK